MVILNLYMLNRYEIPDNHQLVKEVSRNSSSLKHNYFSVALTFIFSCNYFNVSLTNENQMIHAHTSLPFGHRVSRKKKCNNMSNSKQIIEQYLSLVAYIMKQTKL